MSAGYAGLGMNLRRFAALPVQSLLITNKKRRTRKKPGPAYFIW